MIDPSRTNQELLEENALLKQRIHELQESASSYKMLFSNAVEGILFADAETKKFSYANSALCRMFGYTEEEILQLGVEDIHPKESLGNVLAQFDAQWRGKKKWALTIPCLRKDGSIFYANISTSISIVLDDVKCNVGFFTDITERKQAEDKLKESEKRYREFFATSRDCVFITSKEGEWIDFNDAALEMFGYDNREELSQIPIAELYVSPDERTTLTTLIEKKGYVKEHPALLRRRDRMTIDTLITAAIWQNEDRSKIEYYGTIRDITIRKQSEEALRESEQKYRELVDFLPIPLFENDLQGNVTSFNRAIFETFGYTKSDYEKGLNGFQLIIPDDQGRMAGNIQKLLNREKKGPSEYTGIRKDGSTFPFMIFSSVIIRKGKPVGFRGAIIDLTSQKLAQEALCESEERYRSVVEKSLVGIAIVDDAFRYIYVNEEFCRLTGYSEQEMLGKNFTFPLAQESVSLSADRYQRRQRGEDVPSQYEISFVRKTGEKRMGEVRSSVYRDSAGQIKSIIQVVDLTERKRAEKEKQSLEERLNRAEKMEALGTLAGGVAHDLNNVLGVVIGYAELIMSSLNEANPIRSHLMKIMKSSDQAAKIVHDLLTMARRGIAGREVLNLNQIVLDFQNSPEFEKLTSYNTSVLIKADLEPNLLNICGSSVHLSKTLYNLVSNALEAMQGDGHLIIRTANQYLDHPLQGYDEVRDGEYVILSVSDEGEGILANDFKHIFEPFYTKKVMGRSGTGLGLSVVWGTVKDHNGYINVQSEEGKGSTFTLYFPVTRQGLSDAAAAVNTSEYMGREESILVVDDVKGQREMAAEMLRTLNYRVEIVPSGEEAVKYLKEHKADLIILDMIMAPGMDGLDTYRSVLTINPKQKAIIVSGFSETYRVDAAQALGAGNYVRKPYVIEKLGLAVKKELQKT